MKKWQHALMGVVVALVVALAQLMFAHPAFAAPHSVTVTTDGNGSYELDSTSVEEGTRVFVTLTPNNGYAFESCTPSLDLSANDYSEMFSGWPVVGIMFEMPSEDVVLDVTFTAAATVTMDANGGTTGPLWRDQRVIIAGTQEDFSIDDDLIAPPDGKEYDGVEVDGVRYGPSDTYTFTHDVTVVYQWKEPDSGAPMCLVSYDFNGGTQSEDGISSRNMEQGTVEQVRFLEGFAVAPEGMEFDGIEVDGVRYAPGDSWTVPSNDSVTVKFLWVSEDAGACLLFFDVNGGTKGGEWIDQDWFYWGEEVVIPDDISSMALPPAGYVFDGIEIDGVIYKPGDTYTVPDKEEVVVKFLWKQKDTSNSGGRTSGGQNSTSDDGHVVARVIPASIPNTGDVTAPYMLIGFVGVMLILARRSARHFTHLS